MNENNHLSAPDLTAARKERATRNGMLANKGIMVLHTRSNTSLFPPPPRCSFH